MPSRVRKISGIISRFWYEEERFHRNPGQVFFFHAELQLGALMRGEETERHLSLPTRRLSLISASRHAGRSISRRNQCARFGFTGKGSWVGELWLRSLNQWQGTRPRVLPINFQKSSPRESHDQQSSTPNSCAEKTLFVSLSLWFSNHLQCAVISGPLIRPEQFAKRTTVDYEILFLEMWSTLYILPESVLRRSLSRERAHLRELSSALVASHILPLTFLIFLETPSLRTWCPAA